MCDKKKTNFVIVTCDDADVCFPNYDTIVLNFVLTAFCNYPSNAVLPFFAALLISCCATSIVSLCWCPCLVTVSLKDLLIPTTAECVRLFVDRVMTKTLETSAFLKCMEYSITTSTGFARCHVMFTQPDQAIRVVT